MFLQVLNGSGMKKKKKKKNTAREMSYIGKGVIFIIREL